MWNKNECAEKVYSIIKEQFQNKNYQYLDKEHIFKTIDLMKNISGQNELKLHFKLLWKNIACPDVCVDSFLLELINMFIPPIKISKDLEDLLGGFTEICNLLRVNYDRYFNYKIIRFHLECKGDIYNEYYHKYGFDEVDIDKYFDLDLRTALQLLEENNLIINCGNDCWKYKI